MHVFATDHSPLLRVLAAAWCLTQTAYLVNAAPPSAPISPRVVLGCAVWMLGFCINLHADTTLLNLRSATVTGGGWEAVWGWR